MYNSHGKGPRHRPHQHNTQRKVPARNDRYFRHHSCKIQHTDIPQTLMSPKTAVHQPSCMPFCRITRPPAPSRTAHRSSLRQPQHLRRTLVLRHPLVRLPLIVTCSCCMSSRQTSRFRLRINRLSAAGSALTGQSSLWMLD